MTSGGRLARRGRRLVVLVAACLVCVIPAVPARGEAQDDATVHRADVNVPEPATLAYVGVAAAALFRRRRRTRWR